MTQEELDEARKRAMQALSGGVGGYGAEDPPQHPGYTFSQEEADAEEARQAPKPPEPVSRATPLTVAAPSPSEGVDMALGRRPAAANPQTPPRTPAGMRDVALGRERASAEPQHPGYVFSPEEADAEEARQAAPPPEPAPAEAAPPPEPPTDRNGKPPMVPNGPPGAMPQNDESAMALAAPPATPERQRIDGQPVPAPRASRAQSSGGYSDAGRQTGLMFARILDSLFGRGLGREELAGLQAQTPGVDAAREHEARSAREAQRAAQQATSRRSERELSIRERATQHAESRQSQTDAIDKAERDPNSEVSRNAQQNFLGLVSDAGNFDPRVQALLTPDRVGRMSAAEINDPRNPMVRAIVARTQARATQGTTRENATEHQGQVFAGQSELQTQRLSSQAERDQARNENRLAIAQLHARRRSGAGGRGGGGGGGVDETVLRDIVRRGQISGGMNAELAQSYANSLSVRSLRTMAEATGRAVLSAGPTGTQERADINQDTRRAQARESMIPVRQGVQRARALAESASPEEIRAAIAAVNLPSLTGGAAAFGLEGAMPGNLTPRARELAQAIAGFANPLIKDISGAQVTPTEFPRLQQQFGTGLFSTPALLVGALDQAERTLDERDAALDAPLAARDAGRSNLLAASPRAGSAQAPAQDAQPPAPGGGNLVQEGHLYRRRGAAGPGQPPPPGWVGRPLRADLEEVR